MNHPKSPGLAMPTVHATSGNIDSPEYRLLKGTEIAFDYNEHWKREEKD